MLLCILIAPVLLFAQETTADIAGIVSSQEGAVPGASVIAIHQPTGTKYMTVMRCSMPAPKTVLSPMLK